MSTEEYNSLTPRSIKKLIDKKQDLDEYELYLNSRICATIYNVFRDSKKSKFITPEDLMNKRKKDPTHEELWDKFSHVTSGIKSRMAIEGE